MRILSQDGMEMIDVSYDNCDLIVLKDYGDDDLYDTEDIVKWVVYAKTPHFTRDALAEYSTEAKAKKAMEMLHMAAAKNAAYEFLSGKHLKKYLEKSNKDEILCLYFRFPADKDVEE